MTCQSHRASRRHSATTARQLALRACLLATLASLVPAAVRDVQLHQGGGILGDELHYEIQDTTLTGTFFLLLPSLTEGPIPAGAFQLDVGLDLLAAAKWGFYGPGGVGEVLYVPPRNPALPGMKLFAQALTFEIGAGLVVSEVSNRVEVTLGNAGDVQTASDDMHEARRAAAGAILGDCRPTGGGGTTPTGPVGYVGSIEAWDAQIEKFEVLGALNVKRGHASATTLDDGTLLYVGGVGTGSVVLDSVEVFDPSTGVTSVVDPLGGARVFHTATKLLDGRVLVIGGSTQFDDTHPLGAPDSMQSLLRSSSELYDPVTQTWAPGPVLPVGLTSHRASRLDGGIVLVTGGVERPIPGPSSTTLKCYYYVPAPAPGVGSFLLAPPLPVERAMHAQTETAGGDVLLVGGSDIDFGAGVAPGTSTSFIFDGDTLSWSSGPAASGVYTCQDLLCVPGKHPMAPAPSYVVGGGWANLDLASGAGPVQTILTEFAPDLGSASNVGSMTKARLGVRLLPADAGFRVLIMGAGPSPPGNPDTTADIWLRNP